MNRQRAQQQIGRIFFHILLLISLLNVFYIPSQFTDRFFTSGMIWLGIVIPLFFCLFVFFIDGPIRLSAMWLYINGLIIVSCLYAWGMGTFSMQQMSFMFALSLVMLLLGNSKGHLKLESVYFLLSVVALVESILGIGQYFRWYEVYSSGFPVTGTFENPAGLAAYLAISFPFALFFLFYHSFGWRLWGVMTSIASFAAIMLSESRTGIVALAAIAILVIFRYWAINRKTFRILLISGFIVGLLFLSVLYFLKKDSADGRLLIWRCTLEMIREKPLMGHGPEAFGGQYMVHQARWLTQHQNDRCNWLAGNVKHPFNEYLKITSEYGIIGFVAILILFLWLFRIYKRNDSSAHFLFLGLLAVVICSLFSYPLNYPSVCLLLVIFLGLIHQGNGDIYVRRKWMGGGVVLCCIALVSFTIVWKNTERQWNRMAHRSLAGQTEDVLADYARLYRFMQENPLFLYNYGAVLYEAGHWYESAIVLEKCTCKLNDTDVQLLLADDYLNKEDYERAEKCWMLASQMCPNRFLPLYNLVKLYQQTNRQTEALILASEIVRKSVKVPSYTIEKIKKEMAEYILDNSKE